MAPTAKKSTGKPSTKRAARAKPAEPVEKIEASDKAEASPVAKVARKKAAVKTEKGAPVTSSVTPTDTMVYLYEAAAAHGLVHVLEALHDDLGEENATLVLNSDLANSRNLSTRVVIGFAFGQMQDQTAFADLHTAIATILEHLDPSAVKGLSDLLEMARVHSVLYFCTPPILDLARMEDAIDIAFPDEDRANSETFDDLYKLFKALSDNKKKVAANILTRLVQSFPVTELFEKAAQVNEEVQRTAFPDIPRYSAQTPRAQHTQSFSQQQQAAHVQIQIPTVSVPKYVPASTIAADLAQVGSVLNIVGNNAAAAAAGAASYIPAASMTAATVQQMVQAQAAQQAGEVIVPRGTLSTGNRARRWWTAEEDEALFEGLVKFGWGQWTSIRTAYPDVFGIYGRQAHDIKDRFRNLQKKDAADTQAKLDAASERFQRKLAAKKRGRDAAVAAIHEDEDLVWQAEAFANMRNKPKVARGLESDSEDELGIKKKKKKARLSRSQEAKAARAAEEALANPPAPKSKQANAQHKKR